ncbi:hypothetical protein SOVF_095710 isoform A [Spinacia oleracea]|nr:hypothetical protein SOVF_095710 isoform A [Spinacia oleracea]
MWLVIKATGAHGRGARLYDNTAMENLTKSIERFSFLCYNQIVMRDFLCSCFLALLVHCTAGFQVWVGLQLVGIGSILLLVGCYTVWWYYSCCYGANCCD